MRIIDISRPISEKAAVYPGNMPVKLTRLKKFSQGGSNLSGISMGLHTATHLDAPSHYLGRGKEVADLPLGRFMGWCRVLDFSRAKESIGTKEIRRAKPKRGEIILLKTRNSKNPGRKFDPKFVHLDRGGAEALVKAGAAAVGIDGPSIRKFRLKPDDVHPYLLRAGVLIYEGLDLRLAPAGRYYFIGLPLKIEHAEASPVRAVLIK